MIGYRPSRRAVIGGSLALAAARGALAIRLRTPLLDLSKAEIVRLGLSLGVDYGETTSCYDPEPATGAACGHCDACVLRLRGFAEAGRPDPIAYR